MIGGSLAARLHLFHANLPNDLASDTWPVEQIELELWLNKAELSSSVQFLNQLAIRLRTFNQVEVSTTGKGEGATLIVMARRGVVTIPSAISDPQPVILTITAIDADKRKGQINDVLNGWRVTPARALASQFLNGAADSEDFSIRELRRGSVRLMVDEILGRQME